MRHLPRELQQLRTTLLAAVAVGCSTTPKTDDAVPSVVIEPEPPAPRPSVTAAPEPRPQKRYGYVRTEKGAVNRLGSATCSTEVPGKACAGTESRTFCKTDADCTEGAHGRCVSDLGQIGAFCACRYSCANDAECDDGQVCVCGDAVPTPHGASTCAPASCDGPDDCEGFACGVSSYDNGCGRSLKVTCRGEDDECNGNAECDQNQCVADGDHFACRQRSCVIGRPLRVAGELRRAPAIARGDWSAALPLDLEKVDAEQRRAAAAHYRAIAALEHASVGSFARFSLQLLALGAPARLLAATQQAALDEVRHAELMYGLASALGGESLGPGPLCAVEAPPVDPAAVLTALVEEGCVGETLGAVEAAMAASEAQPALAEALRRVADDEGRHAALAWDTLAWMLDRWPELRRVAEIALDEAVARLAPPPSLPASPHLGLLSATEVQRLRDATVEEVVRPLFAAA